jgi:hypothetical protein
MKKILKKLLKWWPEVIFVDPCPMPFYNEYEVSVRVNNKTTTIRLMASNRLWAYLKAWRKYPNAKYIRVVKQIKQY